MTAPIELAHYRFAVLAEQHISPLKHSKRSGFGFSAKSFVVSRTTTTNCGSFFLQKTTKTSLKRKKTKYISSTHSRFSRELIQTCPSTTITSGIRLVAIHLKLCLCDRVVFSFSNAVWILILLSIDSV